MPSDSYKLAILIDGRNTSRATKTLGFDIDFRQLLKAFADRGTLVRAFYYTVLFNDQEFSSIRPLVDWLDYNGFTVVTKPAKEFVDESGKSRTKHHMNVEIVVDAMDLAPAIDEIILFASDADFRVMVAALQRRGVRVTVVSTMPQIGDELRRQADEFIDLRNLQAKIGRDPAARPARSIAT
jgi:uncharacterized LabA/DUF88 family protein